MKFIETQCLSRLGRAGYNSPMVKVAEFNADKGFCTSGQTEKWESKTFNWDNGQE